MKNDKLEEFIKSNREQLDGHSPSDSNWKKIKQTLPGKSRAMVFDSITFWRVAAFVLFGLSTYLFVTRQPDSMNPRQAQTVQQQEFRDIESFYSEQILEKVALISAENEFADEVFTQDFQKLEAMYTVLADEMRKHPSEKVKDALVLNMLVRIDLLNQQIQKLEDSRKKKGAKATSI